MTSYLPEVQVWKLGFGEATGNNANVSSSGLDISTGPSKTDRPSTGVLEENKASAASGAGDSDAETDEVFENYERLD